MKGLSVHFSTSIGNMGGLFCIATIIIGLAAGFQEFGLLVDARTPTEFNVLNFGAVGNGIADDTQAISRAWAATCGSLADSPTMVLPAGKTFFVRPTIFNGPCKSNLLYVQIAGTLLAPDEPSAWNGIDPSLWLQFESVNGLNVYGDGVVNGRGHKWWNQSCRYNPKAGCTKLAPNALKFTRCNDLVVKGLSSVDSPQTHILIHGNERVSLSQLRLRAPADSPNTDGIHIHASKHVSIDVSAIGTGDDCVSIGDYIYNVTINRIACGPGHGISIGSLGIGGARASVEEVHVKHVNFYGTTNGARIKTWQGGEGFAREISFQHCNFTDVDNPIIIDQYYCDVRDKCKSQVKAVEISKVTYSDMHGTSRSPIAISLNCSQSVACTSLLLDNVNLTATAPGGTAQAYCSNAHGHTTGFITPPLSCLL